MNSLDVAPLEGYPLEIATLAAALESGRQKWRNELGEVDPNALRWQPFGGGHSIGALLLHIADVEAWWIEVGIGGRELSPEEIRLLMSEETHQYDVRWPTPPRKTFEEYLEILHSVRERTMRTLREVRDASETRKLGESEFSVRWIVNHVVLHESYHGGQAVLLNLMRERIGT